MVAKSDSGHAAMASDPEHYRAQDAIRSRRYRAAHPERSRKVTARSYRDTKLAYSKAYREANPEYEAARQRKWKRTPKGIAYRREVSWKNHGITGMTVANYDEMFAIQNGLCAICNMPENARGRKHLTVDHNHVTGEIRGLLCNRCNRATGYFGDDATLMASALRYLGGVPSPLF